MTDTRKEFLTAGVRLLERGTHCVTARRVAQTVPGRGLLSHTAVTYYWRTSGELLDAVALEAIRTDNKMAVARLIADGHSSVADWSKAKRRGYLAALA